MVKNRTVKRVAVVGYNRIPFAKINTSYINCDNEQMLSAALEGLIKRYGLQGLLIGEVAGGAVIKHTRESSLTRECVLGSMLDPATPAVDLQQACATGIESAAYIANKIALGQIECGIACGVDSTSNVPIVVGEKFRKILLEMNRTRSFWQKAQLISRLRAVDLLPLAPQVNEVRTGMNMGQHTELTAKYYGISRLEQDIFALGSHQKMDKAYSEGFFEDMISPFQGLLRDNNLRADSSLEQLGKLKPAFDRNNGTLTAGNSTPFTDGASTLLLASEEWAVAHRIPVLAYITHVEVAAINYLKDKKNLLLAPVYAASRMLPKADYTLESFDYYEIHEAFAAQVLSTLKIWESSPLSRQFGLSALGRIDREKLNVKGGSLGAAHPFAATGGRIIATMSKLLHQKGGGKGFISVCAAGGQGITMILEK